MRAVKPAMIAGRILMLRRTALSAACRCCRVGDADERPWRRPIPSKPITLIVPWPAGGSSDIAMRAIADADGENPRPADGR